MVVIVKKKDGTRIKGVKCGCEGGLLYLGNPFLLESDTSVGEGDFEISMGEEIEGDRGNMRLVLIPIVDIDQISSAR